MSKNEKPGLTPQEHRANREEFIDLAEDRELAEGDVTVSETVSGEDPQPSLDDTEVTDQTLGEDDLTVLNEDNPELNLNDDEE